MTPRRSSISGLSSRFLRRAGSGDRAHAAGARDRAAAGLLGTTRSPRISWDSTASMRPSGRSVGPSSCSPLRRPFTHGSRSSRFSAVTRRRRSRPRSRSLPEYGGTSSLALARQVGGDRSAADAALRTLIEKDANIDCATRSPRFTRCGTTRRQPSSGSIGPGATAIRASRTFSTTPSSCATRTIRALPLSAARSACRCRVRQERPPDLLGPRTVRSSSSERQVLGIARGSSGSRSDLY